jgi:hypothetical protein
MELFLGEGGLNLWWKLARVSLESWVCHYMDRWLYASQIFIYMHVCVFRNDIHKHILVLNEHMHVHPSISAIPKNRACDLEIHKLILDVSLPTGVSPPLEEWLIINVMFMSSVWNLNPSRLISITKKYNQLSYAQFTYMHGYMLSNSQIHCLSYAVIYI